MNTEKQRKSIKMSPDQREDQNQITMEREYWNYAQLDCEIKVRKYFLCTRIYNTGQMMLDELSSQYQVGSLQELMEYL